MRTRIFTSGIVMRRGRLLILKRRNDDERNPGKWDCVGGHFLEEESAEDCMLREAKEETGLDAKIKGSGPVFEYLDKYGRAVGVPFLLQVNSDNVRLSEHTDFRWVTPRELKGYDCVPEMGMAMSALKIRKIRK